MTTTSSQSAWEIWIKFLVPETDFQESAAKFAIGFFSYIKIFENTASGHMTEVPTCISYRGFSWPYSICLFLWFYE